MRGLILLFTLALGLSIWSQVVIAQNYEVHKPGGFNVNSEPKERVLFILDFSNSMTEEINGERKIDMMLSTMGQILPKINKNTWVGLRVYGHRMGFTAYDSCKASTLVVPVAPSGSFNVEEKLPKIKARGMTPITYSLKKAVEDDFAGFPGKKHIVLLTDGGENCDESPCVWAMDLVQKRKDIKIDVIAFNIDNPDDLDQLECTALVTSGKFHKADTKAELLNGFNNSLDMRKNVEAQIITNP